MGTCQSVRTILPLCVALFTDGAYAFVCCRTVRITELDISSRFSYEVPTLKSHRFTVSSYDRLRGRVLHTFTKLIHSC